jgi:hypothetical protein
VLLREKACLDVMVIARGGRGGRESYEHLYLTINRQNEKFRGGQTFLWNMAVHYRAYNILQLVPTLTH